MLRWIINLVGLGLLVAGSLLDDGLGYGLLALALAVIIAANGPGLANRLGPWMMIWPPRDARGWQWPLRRMIRLDAAAQVARNRTLDHDVCRVAERMMHDLEDGPLTYFAGAIANSDDVTVYGYRRNATQRERIATAEFARGTLVDRGAAWQRHGDDEPTYTGLQISRADMRRKIRELQEYRATAR
jgi:hypothetical protein